MAATIIEVLQERIKLLEVQVKKLEDRNNWLEKEVRNLERRLKELELAASSNSVKDEIAELRERVERLVSIHRPYRRA